MPSDVVSLVTTGLGVGVLAGILSGVCYVLVHGYKKKRIRKRGSDWYCEICGVYVRQVEDILENTLITCSQCGCRACRKKCAKLQWTKWFCHRCLNPSESWFKEIFHAVQPNGWFNASMNVQQSSDLDAALESLRKLEKEQVRDFIEKLVNVMLCGNVDNASVSKLYNDKQYLPITGQSPSSAHEALKQLIEQLLKEAATLPRLQQTQDHSTTAEGNPSRTYEDLLATAIINKVISSCQSNLPSSSANSVCSHVSKVSCQNESKEYFFGEETLDAKWKSTDLETSSVSSSEEWIQTDSSLGSKKYVDRVTLMIKQDIEEVDRLHSEDEEDGTDYFRSSSSLLGDSDTNWFLQRRHFQGTPSPVPVPMLVPNPTTEAKVFIGDKPVDDTSDLSDVGSDFEEPEPLPKAHTLLIESKTIIGGGKRNPELVEHADEQSESSTDSGVKEVNGREQRRFELMSSSQISKTDVSVDDDNVEDSSFLSVYSNTEKEAEYTERYGSLPRTILKSPTPPARPSRNLDTSTAPKYSDVITSRTENFHDRVPTPRTTIINENEEYKSDSSGEVEFSGSYSKREREKWKHAVQMKNNPYSRENIEKRLQRSSSSVGSSFGADWYAKQAKSPSGGKLKSSEINGVNWPPQKPPEDEIYQYSETNGVHHAVHAVVTDSEQHEALYECVEEDLFKQEPKIQSYGGSFAVESNISLTSDSDLSYVNFYDVENSQIIRKNKHEEISIPIKSTDAQGTYTAISDNNGDEDSLLAAEIHPTIKEVPVAKPRVLGAEEKDDHRRFIKAPTPTQRHLVATTNPNVLRRHHSESDLLADSFDAPPKVLHHRKDNTLISKIYKDHRVRQFAQSTREGRLAGEESRPNYQNQWSLEVKSAPEISLDTIDHGFTSDNDYSSGKTGKMSFSSEEDLLSIHSNASIAKKDSVDVKFKLENEERSSSREIAIRSASPSLLTPKPLSTRKFIYSSSEDLLSTDEVEALPKRKDNTLISKIYKDPKVRKIALNSREFIPDEYQSRSRKISQYNSDEEVFPDRRPASAPYEKKEIYSSVDNVSSTISEVGHKSYEFKREISAEKIETKHWNEEVRSKLVNKLEPDLEEIARKKLVHDILEKLSEMDTSEVHIHPEGDDVRKSVEEIDEFRVSVKDLRKKFEINDGKSKHVVSSLTARSLSKQIKESLRQ
ncbi:uncharacterized protein LOC132696137 isoform X2 [Cylas formicarius]|uniref:uncharacterized protein LOC132696137 isoform X2 n=1 Tax=Cylas formicarius TaxID=197179 RepID=UPI00295835EE|nr:uncharacterized protein LOC132696137 isoform X2 [Cylas formicarius]